MSEKTVVDLIDNVIEAVETLPDFIHCTDPQYLDRLLALTQIKATLAVAVTLTQIKDSLEAISNDTSNLGDDLSKVSRALQTVSENVEYILTNQEEQIDGK